MKTFENAGVAALMALTTVATVMGIDGTLPAMPEITRTLGVDKAATQLSLSLFLVGIAVGQLVHGPIADRFGRKKALVAGLALTIIATAGCATANTIEALSAFRFVHGIAAATGWIVSRAVVRDMFDRQEAARVMSVTLFFHALSPLFVPILGAYLTVHYGWTAVFWFLSAYSTVVMLVFALLFQETIHARNPAALRLGPMLRNFGEVGRSMAFWGYTACAAAAYGMLFSFLSVSADVIIGSFGESATDYSYMFAACMVGNIICMLASARLVHRFGVDALLRFGVYSGVVYSLVIAVFAWAGVHHWAAIIGPMTLCLSTFAFIFPQSVAGALQPFPQVAGAASSLIGFVQQMTGAITGIVVAALTGGTQLWLANGILFWAVFGLAAYLLVVRKNRTI